MQRRQLELSKKKYRKALARFKNMQEWEKTATPEEIKKYENEIYKVIEDCRIAYEEVKKWTRY